MSGLILGLSTLQSPVFLLNSRLGQFSASVIRRIPFSRSYGVILPSSLAMNHSSALEFSSRLPVSVCGTVTVSSCLEDFLGSMIRVSLWARPSYSCLRIMFRRIYLPELPTHLNPDYQNRDLLSLLRPPIVQTILNWYRNIKPVFHRLRLSASA